MNGELKTFQPAKLEPMTEDEFLAKFSSMHPAISEEQWRAQYRRMQEEIIWLNDEYQVNIRQRSLQLGDDTYWDHLSIKRVDRAPVHDWRDLQAIKNKLYGPEYEAVELYPAESRLGDTANQYHLWVLVDESGDPVQIPVGWFGDRLVLSTSSHGAVQRPPANGETS
ncbi:MAG: hypothetical protein KDJ69_12145 [Nitratireductor sp.]|nr:hypothetical protein [Nitratireductor sp.]